MRFIFLECDYAITRSWIIILVVASVQFVQALVKMKCCLNFQVTIHTSKYFQKRDASGLSSWFCRFTFILHSNSFCSFPSLLNFEYLKAIISFGNNCDFQRVLLPMFMLLFEERHFRIMCFFFIHLLQLKKMKVAYQFLIACFHN